MNKRRNAVIQLAILVTLGAAVILTMVLPQVSSGRKKEPLTEISVIIRESDSSLWSNTRLGMEQAAGELGAELRFLALSEANDGAEQAGMMAREAEGGAEALVVVPAQPEELDGRLTELVDQIPVVAMESRMARAALLVAPDNEVLGQTLAQAVLEDWQGGVVLLMDTAGNSTGVSERLEAADRTLREAGVPTQRRIACPDDMISLLKGMATETGADQIMLFEVSATEQAVQAKNLRGLTQSLYGVGVSASVVAGLERGVVSAVAAWSDYAAGYLAVEGAVQLAKGAAYEMERLPFSLVRGEDIYDPDNQKLLFPVTS